MSGQSKPLCFVIGPIGPLGSTIRKHADRFLHDVVKHVLEQSQLNYKVVRSDQAADPGMINDKVIHDILHAKLVVADLTFLNANAFYELGIRHSALLPTIHFAQTGTDLPFDTAGYRAIMADLTDWHGIESARTQLLEAATTIDQPGYYVSNPITQANASFKMRESEDPKDALIVDLSERVRRLEMALHNKQIEEFRKLLGKKTDKKITTLGQLMESLMRSAQPKDKRTSDDAEDPDDENR